MNIGFRLRCSAVLAVVTIALAALAPLRPAYGMEFSITTTSPLSGTERKLNYVLLKWEIVPGDYNRLLEFAVNNNVDLAQHPIILASPGGDVSEALKIGELLKRLYVAAVVGPVTQKFMVSSVSYSVAMLRVKRWTA